MAIARLVKTEITKDDYDQMLSKLGVQGTPPPGGVFHLAAVGDDGKIKIVEIWDSREEAEAWAEKVAAARQASGFAEPSVEFLDVHNVIQR
jgi:hypothetical protein